ncbi:hypothetical protein BTZ20_4197 [Rhodococcus sp. MTM3W5.2]|nr:hypothetical protein BTZ20_4197 [Rhodococcus sp. MTM3W5.2]
MKQFVIPGHRYIVCPVHHPVKTRKGLRTGTVQTADASSAQRDLIFESAM